MVLQMATKKRPGTSRTNLAWLTKVVPLYFIYSMTMSILCGTPYWIRTSTIPRDRRNSRITARRGTMACSTSATPGTHPLSTKVELYKLSYLPQILGTSSTKLIWSPVILSWLNNNWSLNISPWKYVRWKWIHPNWCLKIITFCLFFCQEKICFYSHLGTSQVIQSCIGCF